jgi:two-component system cell cycle sensor histidine kinase/response regulator CckA
VGVGTALKVYLPRTDVCPVPDEHGIGTAAQRGNETILVVEDEQSVRSFTVAALERYGYHVIEACDGDEAIAVAQQHSGRIQLLLTDVIMPGMNGKVLSERLKESYPDLKVLLTSGYTADAFADRGVIDPGDVLLRKPFAQQELAVKVREVLAQSS